MESDILIPIGKRISEIRRSNKVTQEALADMLNISPKHVSHTERGASCLSLKNLIEFCNIFNCSLDYIIFGIKENSVLSKLPKEIVEILYTGNDNELELLNHYLQIYAELHAGNK
ncbi:MAG: helix-turn-helix transcriptional regulator [Lachnospiraceae bacterium]|nr:helix-turn-helix transcriptional regulator [Lachnospiraceae bacterium]